MTFLRRRRILEGPDALAFNDGLQPPDRMRGRIALPETFPDQRSGEFERQRPPAETPREFPGREESR